MKMQSKYIYLRVNLAYVGVGHRAAGRRGLSGGASVEAGGGASVAAGGKAGWHGVGAAAGCDRGEREKGVGNRERREVGYKER